MLIAVIEIIRSQDAEEFLDSMKQCSVQNVRIERLWREMKSCDFYAFYKDMFVVIFNFLEVSCLLVSNSELGLFAL